MTSESQNIQQLNHLKGPDQILIGNGQGLHIRSSGSSTLSYSLNPTIPFTLTNLLLVPSITKNLISVSQFFKDNGVYFEFHPTFYVVKSQATDVVMLKGQVGFDGLYYFLNLSPHNPSVTSAHPPTCCLSSSSSSAANNTSAKSPIKCNRNSSLWHIRLGHPNCHILKLVMKSCNIPNSNSNTVEFCQACTIGKSHCLPSQLSSTMIFGVLHIFPPRMGFYTVCHLLMLSLDSLGFIC